MERTMKDSGIEWIGLIPDGWNVRKLKSIAKIQTGNTPDKTSENYYTNDEGLMWVKSDNLNGIVPITNTAEKLSEEGSKVARIARKGSTLVCCIGSIGKYGIIDTDVAYNQQINAVTFDNNVVLDKFGTYLIAVSESQHWLYANGNVLKILNNEGQGKIAYAIPDLVEQKQIAKFLDDKVIEIDTIISKTKESITDYKKYKQSVITEAMTQGLDKSIAIVDTDNIHIPTIPAHWKMKKIKYIFEIKKDIAGKEGYDILSITQKGIKIKDISKNEGQLAQNYSNYQLVDIGDFAMNHMDLLTGWVDISRYVGVTSPDYRVFRFIDATGYDADYYLYLMQMCYMNRIFYGLGQGVSNLGRWRLQADKFLNFTIPEPPLVEQQEIAKYLSVRCTEIDALITKKEAFVEEMEAYKKSLIYEYVTGKKEVL